MRNFLLFLLLCSCGHKKFVEPAQVKFENIEQLKVNLSSCQLLAEWDGVKPYGMFGDHNKILLFMNKKLYNLVLKTNEVLEAGDLTLEIGSFCSVIIKNSQISQIIFHQSPFLSVGTRAI